MRRVVSVLVFLIFVVSYAYAENNAGRGIISYGDNCQLCGEYAYCNRTPTHREAVNALSLYYEKRGHRVIVLRQKERFLEAEIYKNGHMVDRVLLDLRTGRIRSTY
jgi:hypothetical protein